MSNILVCGAGGFIGGHLVKKFMDEGHNVICADFKPFEYWCQFYEENKNHSLDLKEKENTDIVTQDVDYVFNMACNMGGMGFIENNKTECMLSVLINTNMCRSSLKNKVKRLDSQTNFLWIDKCQKIIEYKKIESTYLESHYCILLEDKKNIKYQLLGVDSKNINKELIKKHFNDE